MVQLKSFRYIESEAGGEVEGGREELREQQEDKENKQESDQNQHQPASSSSQSSVSSIIVAGGNLTSEESATNEDADERESTLSSSEEYQMAQHDITGSEDSEDASTRIKIDGSRQQAVAASKPLSEQPKPNPLDGARRQFYVARKQAHPPKLVTSASSASLTGQSSAKPKPLMGRSMSTSALRQQQQQQQMQHADSQHSLGANQKVNQFEIRWHNINLIASKSSLPRFISEHPLYKLFKGEKHPSDSSSDEGEKVQPEKIYYSPPIRHKFSCLPSVSETLELQTQGSPGFPRATQGWQTTNTASNSVITGTGGSQNYRHILNNVSGSVSSGQLTAILGPSGVGKTSLLNSLTGRNTLDGTGRVSLLGSGASRRMSVVTVPQNDVLPGKLTTIEDLNFTSRLKNPQAKFNHQRNIDRIVKHLQMEKFLHTRIDKLSGGEARRLSIGRELLQSPDIMILDEPTSGLDANTCKKIITALRDIVEHSENILDRPMAIIITIHQPQQEVLNLFHRVYVMAIGGRTIYEGSPGNMLETLLGFSSLNRVCQHDQLNQNPAIVALEVASGEFGPQLIDELAMHHESQVYEENGAYMDSPRSTPLSIRQLRRSPLSVSPRFELLHRARLNASIGRQTPKMNAKFQGQQKQQQFDQVSTVTSISYASTYDADLPEPVSRLKVDKRLRRSVVTKSHFLAHTLTLMSRCWLLTTRDLFLMSIRILGFLGVAGGIVQIFASALDPNESQCPVYESEVDDVLTYIRSSRERLLNLSHVLRQASSTHLFFFHILLCITMVSSALTGLVFPLQMRMFIREYKNGWYSPASFITSITLAELPVDMIGPIITLVITYPLCNQPVSDYYWREIGYILVIILMTVICKAQAQICGAFLMDSVQNSVFASCVAVSFPALTSGIAVRVSQMSWPLQIISYGSFLRYSFESLLLLRYGYGICPCDAELIDGYPVRTTTNAIPPQLDNLAQGFLELNNNNQQLNNSSALQILNDTTTTAATFENSAPGDDEHSNLFLKFLKLITEASNMFVTTPQDLGDCNKYRSLYLMDMNIDDMILTKWVLIMLLMFIISRFLTYFAVKTVIKMRR